MKSMLRFFPALLAVWPYGILCIGLFEEDSAGSMVFLWVYCGLTAALLLFQILYCCLHRASARTFAFWNLTVKLCHIPFYLAVFALGVLMTMAMVVPALLFVSPAVNLLLAAALAALGRWWEPLYLLAGAQGVLGCFNLLPILPLDGGRMLWLALCWGTDPFLADRVTQAVSLATAGLLTAAGAALAGRSPFLLMTAVCLLCCTAGPCIKRRKSVYASGKREASA